jgi:hypothetical protein
MRSNNADAAYVDRTMKHVACIDRRIKPLADADVTIAVNVRL